jgi:hypothetical protein
VHPGLYTDALWQVTDKIYNEARRCYDHHLDEGAWMKVVNNVLDSAELDKIHQEVSHIHLRIPQQRSTRQYAVLDCRPEQAHDRLVVIDDADMARDALSAFQKIQKAVLSRERR